MDRAGGERAGRSGDGRADRAGDGRALRAGGEDAGRPEDGDAGRPVDLVAVLARARSTEAPGPDTPAGPAVRPWPGPSRPLPAAGPGELDLDRLLRLSLAAQDGTGRLRPAASAGALHPVDARLVVGPGCPLPPGRYGYDPVRHRVHRLAPAPDGPPPGATVELSVTVRRTASHYGHRAWPLALLDTGHAAGALWLAGRARGGTEPVLRLDGRGEQPLAAVHFAPPGDAAPLAAGAHEPPARRSAPPPLRGTPSPDDLRTVLATAAEAGAGELAWCAAVGEPRPALVGLAPDGTLRRLAAGEARPTLAVWAAGQRWIADAGAVLLGYGCPADAGPRRIRRAHLRAGFAVHLAQVAAVRRGLGARPVGAWQQADLGAALGAAPGRDWIVHGLALGTTYPATGPAPGATGPRPAPASGTARPGPTAPPPTIRTPHPDEEGPS
ncbi:SagB/ThcOx family dehydrogenase [Streptomyces sp. NPDC085946]|uniref:SagB/ThcOx family dehydrogenase n=1 Tax=Streptomyces sp. NPDC085946 TaxID=3365744 RepID=UPI0037CDDAFD